MARHFLQLTDFTKQEFEYILERSLYFKVNRQKLRMEYKPLANRSLVQIFEKQSTRTRVSFDVGMYELGGNSVVLNSQETQISRGEAIKDTARVLSRYADAVMIRTYRQETLTEFAKFSSIPVINGLSDMAHPLQIVADIMTIMEHKKNIGSLKIAYIGDGNNVANSWMLAAGLLGLDFHCATPKNYGPDKKVRDKAVALGLNPKNITNNPIAAAADADVLLTDVWVSMGKEAESNIRIGQFKGFGIDRTLVNHAKKDYLFLHCLPAHREYEVTDEVMESQNSKVFDEAENRLHTTKAILEFLLIGQVNG